MSQLADEGAQPLRFDFDGLSESEGFYYQVTKAIDVLQELAAQEPKSEIAAAYRLGRVAEVGEIFESAFYQFVRSAREERQTAIAAKNNAYSERNQLIAFMARVLAGNGYVVGLGKHDPEDKNWEDDWRNDTIRPKSTADS